MAKRNSPMKTKVFMANMREFKKLAHLPPLPELGAETPRISRGVVPEFRISRGERIRLELSRRTYMTPAARAARAALIGVR